MKKVTQAFNETLFSDKNFESRKIEAVHLTSQAFVAKMSVDYTAGRVPYKWVTSSVGPDGRFYKLHANGLVEVADENEILRFLYDFPYVTSMQTKREIVNYIKSMVGSIDQSKVLPVTLKDDSRLAWVKLPFTLEEARAVSLVSMPAFNNFLERSGSGARSLVLWLGSLLDPAASRSQYLHLYGSGGDGKSTLLESIRRVMGHSKVVSASATMFNDKHFGEELEGARILVFPDENNPRFFSSGKFKEYTGESGASINPKNKPNRYLNFTHKTIVFSNNEVEITSSKADMRRLLSITVESDTDSDGVDFKWWYQELLESGAKILAYCYCEYLKELEITPTLRAYIAPSKEKTFEAMERNYAEIESAILQNFAVTGDKADKVNRSYLHSVIAKDMGSNKSNKLFVAHLKEALKRLGIEEKKQSNWYYVGITTQSDKVLQIVKSKVVT